MDNCILSSLPVSDYRRLSSQLSDIALRAGQVIYEPGQRIDYLYFPTSAVVNLIHITRCGTSAEAWTAGNDGMISVHAFLLSDTIPTRALVQTSGFARRIRAEVLLDEFSRAGALQHVLLRYAQLVINHVGQMSVCNRLHSFDQRLCRWLLLSHARAACNNLVMTHDLLAMLLGGRRESVTTAARRLQQAGLIHYSRGHIAVLDKPGLEQRACECYPIMQAEINEFKSFANPPRTSLASCFSPVGFTNAAATR